MVGSYKIAGSSRLKTENDQMAKIQPVCSSTHHKMHVIKSTSSLTNQSNSDSLLTVCLFRHLILQALVYVRQVEKESLSKSRLLNFWLYVVHT